VWLFAGFEMVAGFSHTRLTQSLSFSHELHAMSSTSHNPMSARTARIISFGGWIAIFAIFAIQHLAFDFPDGSPAARISAGILMLITLLIFGGVLAARMHMSQKLQLDFRGFIRFSIDIALLPMTIPVLLVLCFAAGQIPITYLATPWFGERFASILGFEFGAFVVLIAVPYAMFVWPILHRVRRSRSPDAYLLAPKTWMVMCGFALFSIVIIFARPPTGFWILVCVSWLCFSAVYRWLLLPRFPRYNMNSGDVFPCVTERRITKR
jgi:hypothetical protein